MFGGFSNTLSIKNFLRQNYTGYLFLLTKIFSIFLNYAVAMVIVLRIHCSGLAYLMDYFQDKKAKDFVLFSLCLQLALPLI